MLAGRQPFFYWGVPFSLLLYIEVCIFIATVDSKKLGPLLFSSSSPSLLLLSVCSKSMPLYHIRRAAKCKWNVIWLDLRVDVKSNEINIDEARLDFPPGDPLGVTMT